MGAAVDEGSVISESLSVAGASGRCAPPPQPFPSGGWSVQAAWRDGARLAAWASAASRTQAPSSQASTRAARRSLVARARRRRSTRLEFAPVDGAEVVRLARLVPFRRSGSGKRHAEQSLPARPSASMNFCRSSSLLTRLMPQRIDCALFGRLVVRWTEHHDRRTTTSGSRRPAPCLSARRVPWVIMRQQALKALALVEALLAADADHRTRIGARTSSGRSAPGS